MSDDTPDLSLVSGDDLIAELAKRHDALIVCWEDFKSDTQTEFFCDWRGALTFAIGLATRARAGLVQNALKTRKSE
jgi:hypothetical protein